MSIRDFKVLNPLGKGAFASVFKVERKSDKKIYALKRVNISKQSKREVQDAVNEIRVLASIRHPHIVGFLQAFLDKGDSELCIVMEFCGCGDLAQKVDRYKKRKQHVDERVIWAYLIQLADSLKALHGKNIIHRDIKTANCFLSDDGSLKLGDLNVSKRMKNGLLQTQIGTPYYMSPEIWANKPYNGASDIWALGCTLYELAALRPPFLGDSFPQLKRAVVSGRYPSLPRHYSQDLTDVIGKMLNINPQRRPTCQSLLDLPEVMARRNSDWFNKLPTHEVVADVALMNTIQVPRNLGKLQANLPKSCYPDARPNSPESWPVTDRNRADKIEQKRAGALDGAAAAAAAPAPNVSEARVSPRLSPRSNANANGRASPRANAENPLPSARDAPAKRVGSGAAQQPHYQRKPLGANNAAPSKTPRGVGGGYGQYNRGGQPSRPAPRAQPPAGSRVKVEAYAPPSTKYGGQYGQHQQAGVRNGRRASAYSRR